MAANNIQLQIDRCFLNIGLLEKIRKLYAILLAQLFQLELVQLSLYVTHQPALNRLHSIMFYTPQQPVPTLSLRGRCIEKAIHLQSSRAELR